MRLQFERQGDIISARGENWTYEQVGEVSMFTQLGKIPSLRAVKVFLKWVIRLEDKDNK